MFYLAIHSRTGFNPETISPRFMRWDDAGVWIIDLQPVLPYWMQQAGLTGQAGWQHARSGHFHDFLRQLLPVAEGAGAAFIDVNPWRALLGLSVMRDRGLSGLVSGHNGLGRHFPLEVAWESWFQLAEQVGELWFANRRERFNLQVFRRQMRQMEQAMDRLGMRKPGDLGGMGALAIRRRYGAALHDLWLLTVSEQNQQGICIQETESPQFPWKSWQREAWTGVRRHLDAPLMEWDAIEALLREDMDRLCALLSKQGGERVLSLEWRVVFLDMSSLSIPVRFRHPHDLPAESPHHRTALLQACYAYRDAIPAATSDAVDLGLYEKAIGSWELAVTEKIHWSPVMRDLFGECVESQAEASEESGESQWKMRLQHKLQQMENRLPVQLDSYEVNSNWIPGEGYLTAVAAEGGQEHLSAVMTNREVSKKRPMFLFAKPRPWVQPPNRSSVWEFCERVMEKWWSGSGRFAQRDYYRLQSEEQKSMWVFKDSAGKWHIHGMYN